jgi:hypothetical protein
MCDLESDVNGLEVLRRYSELMKKKIASLCWFLNRESVYVPE